MLDFTEISIQDKKLFDRYFGLYNPESSELNFSNIFMWRTMYKTRYTIINDLLCIISVSENKEPFALMPVGNVGNEEFYEAIVRLKQYFYGKGWKLNFKDVTEQGLEAFKKAMLSDLIILEDRDNADYVYATEDLIHLQGKKYDGKRNHINKFKSHNEFEYYPIKAEQMNECFTIMEKWCAEKACNGHDTLFCEKVANTELLNHYSILGLKGAIIKVNGVYEAFTVGEMLNKETALIHIEKASSKIDGLYPFINQQFCTNEWSNTLYVNREQDVGVEGLRRAKLSYHPVKLINKYDVVVK